MRAQVAVLVALTVFAIRPLFSFAEQAMPASQSELVDKLFQPWNTSTTPGCAVAVMKSGEIVYEHGYGMADLNHEVRITPTTVFNVGSVSKQFTAMAAMILADQGKISLDDPIRKYLPEVPDFGAPIALRELLHHTSGLRDWQELLAFDGWRMYGDVVTDQDVMAALALQKDLNFPPGSKFMYSNTGYTLLAHVVSHVSGKSFREFTTSQLFEPLGMQQTHFREDHGEVVKGLAYGYEQKESAFEMIPAVDDVVGPGNLLTTVEDLARWDENFYQARVGGGQAIKQMYECGSLNDGTRIFWGAGLVVGPTCGKTVVEPSGSDSGYVADLIRFPPQHLSVATLCNLGSVGVLGLTHRVAEIYGGKLGTASIADAGTKESVEPKKLASKAGLYVNPDGDVILRVREQNGALWADSFLDDSIELEPLTDERFRDPAMGELDFGSAKTPDRGGINLPSTYECRNWRQAKRRCASSQARIAVRNYTCPTR
jgi:CubicO group peptidase (beta-lactamase class C family)